MGLFDLIRHCDSLEELNFFILSEIWKGSADIRNAILIRYDQLDPDHKNKKQFGTIEFWEANPLGPYEFEDAWFEADGDMVPEAEPWMLEDDYRQAGGQAEILEEPTPDMDELYEMIPYSHQEYKRYFSGRTACAIRFKDSNKMNDFFSLVPKVWDDILQWLFKNLGPDDKVGVYINHPCLTDPIPIPLTKRCLLTGEKIANKVAKTQQSKTELKYGEEMTAVFIYSKMPIGMGFKRDYQGSVKEHKENHKGHGGTFITINNRDHSCCARAIVTAKALIDSHPKWNAIRQGDHKKSSMQKQMAEDLMKKAGLKHHVAGCGFEEIKMMQKVLGPVYQIKVWDRFRELLFKTEPAAKVMHLYLDNKHYDVISHIKQFHNASYFCDLCDKPYKNVEDHLCSNKCICCRQSPACQFSQWIFCPDCNRNFRSQLCYDNHCQKKSDNNGHTSSICHRLKRCPNQIGYWECGTLLKREDIKQHCCGFSKCRLCGDYSKMEDHQCYMHRIKPENPDIEPFFIVFDLETQQSKEYKQTDMGPMYLHEPNLCIAYKFCSLCKEEVLEKKNFNSCIRCGPNRMTFEGATTIEDFGKWLYVDNKGRKKNPVIAIAHNARGFDAQFLINYLAEWGYRPKITPKGHEIMQLEASMVVVKDSLNFLPMALAALPKAFGFESEAKKGYFPHYFNTAENEGYDGPLPDHQYYGTANMTEANRKKFFDWYTPLKKTGYKFNLKTERWDYCDNNVYICAKAIMKFRDLVFERTGVDPLQQAMTIASTTSVVYRQNFLPEKTIGLIPPGGYRKNDIQSITAFIWLQYVSERDNIRIQHARNGGEKVIQIGDRKIKVDGYAEINGVKTVYEFHGCRFHGCPRCYRNRDLKLFNEPKTMEERYQNTLLRTQTLEKAGYKVIELWGCELDEMKRKDPGLALYFRSAEIKYPMDPRMAFFSGRTNAIKLYIVFKNGDKGHYGDMCSLYPTTLMYDAFPVGHPTVITENFERITKKVKPYKGLIYCTVEPPRQLLHPVLPYKSMGKTTFPLCRTCVDQRQTDPCTHSDSERQITGAWTHVELNKAVNLGYWVAKIHEVYHYDKWMQYDGKDPKTGLFTDYILIFLKLKQEKSSWPSWVKTDEDADRYTQQYEEHMGIRLDPNEIEKNNGLRAVAKLFLNSFWGKFGQRENRMQQQYVTPQQFFEMYHDEKYTLLNWEMISAGEEDESATMLIRYKMNDDFAQPLKNTNVVLAAYVTAHARLWLYKFLEQLQERVLYFDTDSVFYTSKPGEENIPVGDYLGDMTDELAEYGEGSYLTEFISAGPKNYSYKVYSTKDKKIHQVIKVKGHPLDFTSMKHVNAKTMKRMVIAYVKSGRQDQVVVVSPRIQRVGHHVLVTRLVRKTYRVVYDKRVVCKDYSTLPFGY